METGGSSYYYTADALGSTILLSNSSDAAAATYTYDAWGTITSTVTGIAATNPFRYAGGYEDSNGLTKFGTRYYNPAVGRFTQADPSGQESNVYAYSGDDPTDATDSTGRLSGALVIKIIVADRVPCDRGDHHHEFLRL
jgi:RHS repeat-associated protein